MNELPLLFSFRDLVAGNGFIAGVAIDGRALCFEEDDQTWISGVQPGAITASGADQNAALLEFKKTYLGVLFDMAAEAETFHEFQRAVTGFFTDACAVTAAEWEAALEAVRKNHTSVPGLKTINAQDHQPRVSVQEIRSDLARAGRNEMDCVAKAA